MGETLLLQESEYWDMVSRELYGEDFIDQLANLFQNYGKRVLECGTGGGHILQGLAKRGFTCIGVDNDSTMYRIALDNNKQKNVKYKFLNILNLQELKGTYDIVMCRGNTLASLHTWNKMEKTISPKEAADLVVIGIRKMFEKTRTGGLIYLDTITRDEAIDGKASIQIITKNITGVHLVQHYPEDNMRRVGGGGVANGESYVGESWTHLLPPERLEEIISQFKPAKMWTPMVTDKYHHIVVAVK